MQKLLIVSTLKSSVRSEIQGWSTENADAVVVAYKERLGTKYEYPNPNEVPVGLIGGSMGASNHYPTVLHAMGDGWKLMAPPTKYDYPIDEGNTVVMWEWWLTKD